MKITDYRLKISYDGSLSFPFSGVALIGGRNKTIFSDDFAGFRDADMIAELFVKAAESARSAEEHFLKFKNKCKNAGLRGFSFFPVMKYEHGSVAYRLGANAGDWDSGFWGVLVYDNTELGIQSTKKETATRDIATITRWANGEAYRFNLESVIKCCDCTTCDAIKYEYEDSCSGFYSIEDMRGYLPECFKNEDLEEYLQY